MELTFFLFLFTLSIYIIFSQKKHFLSVLLVMELITLRIFITCSFLFGLNEGVCSVRFCIIFLVFGVYEAANGLGLLVSRRRSDGFDMLRGLFTLRF